MSAWKEAYDANRSSELNDLREGRLRACVIVSSDIPQSSLMKVDRVKERLYDEGWGYLLDNPVWWPRIREELTDLKTVNKASRLTDKSSCKPCPSHDHSIDQKAKCGTTCTHPSWR